MFAVYDTNKTIGIPRRTLLIINELRSMPKLIHSHFGIGLPEIDIVGMREAGLDRVSPGKTEDLAQRISSISPAVLATGLPKRRAPAGVIR